MPVRESIAGAIPTPHIVSEPVFYGTFGGQVADIRKQQQMTQQQLATKAGLSRNQISLIERNKAANLTLDTFCRLATALQVNVGQLFDLAVRQVEKGD